MKQSPTTTTSTGNLKRLIWLAKRAEGLLKRAPRLMRILGIITQCGNFRRVYPTPSIYK
ncbi:hypothetical protein DAPPUDRAFT_251615 [Daphnia pulex]|uniref:Uncharacterized protein n=1 Tax=Daphnia pulex TaxID=6669 RepID=E9H0S0_DAPPU|nr:hypothetical protein DAPPUDRAFT_251615 [Daphnia pulex]|eukprot:EFX74692.1 hypothetical protein DAPPUDRAFT_251615 [Daphnia pulex]